MYLKRLEVIGFKSFADRIGIDFVPGVTAVVGPNGSGKSNVTDAIRWVLGEQSAKSLRGSKMEDVIFAGSDTRKPLNFAEVTLVLDNTDGRVPLSYSEISVTRRVFRSGDSAYLLNKQNCRLKDITDLFMDSGLGKEAFSIISQGRVDEILNSKAEDRRTLFEEAAGVLKYKQRKKKAEVKLAETEDNLSRVLDILHELDGRMEPLQLQASKARDFLAMTEELKGADIALLAHDIKLLEQESASLKQESSRLASIERGLNEQIGQQEQSAEGLKKELQQLDALIDEAQHLLVEASAEHEKWEGRKLLMSEKRQNAERQTDQLMQQLKTEQEENARLTGLLAEQTEILKRLKKEQQTAAADIRQLESQLNLTAADLEKEIDVQKAIYIELMNEQATAKNELKNVELQEQQVSASTDRVLHQTASFENELSGLRLRKKEAEENLTGVRSRLHEKREAYREAEARYTKLSTAMAHKQSLLEQARQNERQLSSRIDTLQELEADFSGFFQGVREVLLARERGELTGIAGAVAEMLQVEEPYARAVETALGASSQHIVTEDEETARKAIDFLRSKRAGRATFLPVTVMKPRRMPDAAVDTVRSHPSFVAVAYELVSCEASYRHVMENLLGNVLIAKDLKGAGAMAKLLGNRYRVVTLEGDVVNAGGSMTGGASRAQTSVFSRKTELDRLISQLSELKSSIRAAEQTVEEGREKEKEAALQLDKLRLQGEELRSEEAEQSAAFREADVLLRTAEERFELFRHDQQRRDTDLGTLKIRRETAVRRLAELAEELQSASAEIDRLTSFKQQSESVRQEVAEKMNTKKAELAVVKERIAQIAVTESDLLERKAKSDRLAGTYQQELDWLQSDEATKLYSEQEIIEAISKWSEKRDVERQNVQNAKQQRSERQSMLEQLTEELKEQQRIQKGYAEALHTCEMKRTRADVQIAGLVDQLSENYGVGVDEARSFVLPGEEEAVRKQVKLLKRSIEELGPVNTASIAEFEQVSERYNFLTEQRSDLNEAKETLRTVIHEMDEEMTIRFDDTFHAIRTQFRHVFKELFGGGSADLVLTNPEDMLGTGIEIVAQPPGKKLQNLSLLSGGERALTAIALLFASLNIRPVPFCILDEVEAALDESNVVRYSNYLKKFSEQTQFIVITHRKGTMEGADVLYGITMQESGISKLVSVNLQEV